MFSAKSWKTRKIFCFEKKFYIIVSQSFFVEKHGKSIKKAWPSTTRIPPSITTTGTKCCKASGNAIRILTRVMFYRKTQFRERFGTMESFTASDYWQKPIESRNGASGSLKQTLCASSRSPWWIQSPKHWQHTQEISDLVK